MVVPAGIGINIDDPGVHSGSKQQDGSTGYGGIDLCAKPCISPLHTHDGDRHPSHRVSDGRSPTRSAQFFTEWDVRLSHNCVGGYCRPSSIQFYVDGKPYTATRARSRSPIARRSRS